MVGVFHLRTVLSAIAALSVSDGNKVVIMTSNVLPLVTLTLNLYDRDLDRDPSCILLLQSICSVPSCNCVFFVLLSCCFTPLGPSRDFSLCAASHPSLRYADNAPLIPKCGGGGRDPETAHLAITILLQLCFHYADTASLRAVYATELGVDALLLACLV